MVVDLASDPAAPTARGGSGPGTGGRAADPLFVVNSVGDAKAANPAAGAATGNMVTLDNGRKVPEVTLRSAIQAADADNQALETIGFQIPNNAKQDGVWTIRPATALDAVTRPTAIDGTGQMTIAGSATPVVVVSGAGLGNNMANGLQLTAGGSTVRGLVIDDFDRNGIDLSGKGGDLVVGDFIGIDAGGTKDFGNLASGVLVDNVAGNTVGGTAAGDRDVIAGNAFNNVGPGGGVLILGPDAKGNVVLGDDIGTDKAGTSAIPNRNGVVISLASGNTVGGADALSRDVIAGNASAGVRLVDGAGMNQVQGNYIGVDMTGKAALPNVLAGVLIDASTDNTVGGSTAAPGTAPGNVIAGNGTFANNSGSEVFILDGSSGNQVQGNFVGIGADDLRQGKGEGVAVANSPRNTIGGTAAERNIISGNGRSGVDISGPASRGDAVQGDFIGTDENGAAVVANGGDGVLIRDAIGATVGPGNVISGNSGSGVRITGATPRGSVGDAVLGNRIGTDKRGNVALPNQGDGVTIEAYATGNTVGGDAAGQRNLIAGNGGNGVAIVAKVITSGLVDAFAQPARNAVLGNLIGTDDAGLAGRMNAGDGVLIQGARENTVGGAAAGARNLIAGNGGEGIRIVGFSTQAPGQPAFTFLADRNQVLNDVIGLNANGDPLGNAGDGVAIDVMADDNTVGGTLGQAGNVIASNGQAGVILRGLGKLGRPEGNVVVGNFIGTDDRGRKLGNGRDGVLVVTSVGNTIGGVTAGDGNVVADNGRSKIPGFGNGIHIVGLGQGAGMVAALNQVQGNRIGTDAAGLAKVGNLQGGILVQDASGNTIGGPTATPGNGPGNVIAGDGGHGVQIQGKFATGNMIQGNAIGTNPAGGAGLGNAGAGVFIGSGAGMNLVGGVGDGQANRIANNTGAGVDVDSGVSNGIHRNSIDGNAGGGIVLNFANNANKMQAAPDPVKAVANPGGTLTVKGLVRSKNQGAFATITIEVFDDDVADPTKAQGMKYLTTVAAKPTGNANEYEFSVTITGNFQGHFITTTATDTDDDTSAFSAPAKVM